MELKILRKEELNKSIAVVVGTRPGIIKFSPVIKELKKRNVDFFIIHTGQHYSYNMDKQFFKDLGLPDPKYTNNKVKNCKFHGEQTAEMIKGIEQALIKEKPSIIIVDGDANTNLAGALAGRKLGGIKVVHMEAGLRSNDWSMPEEHNRVIMDHISEILLAPTEQTKQNLIADNVKGKIFVVGNTISDAVVKHARLAEDKSEILKKLNLNSNKFILMTAHREENVDFEEKIKEIIQTIERVIKEFKQPIVFPIHPRTKKRLKEFNLLKKVNDIDDLKIIKATGYFDFLKLLTNCSIVLTDSGGIQEESCILNVPCVTLRENTERPETVEVGANIIATTKPEKVCEAIRCLLEKDKNKEWPNPFGEKASQKIVDILISNL